MTPIMLTSQTATRPTSESLPATPTAQNLLVPPASGHDLLTLEQAAQVLHISVSSLRCFIREGKLKAFRVAGLRKLLIPRRELMSLLVPTA